MTAEMKWPAHLVIVRHGESKRNVEKEVARKNGELVYASEIRDVDTPLTDRGVEQARQTGEHLARTYKFDQVVASPYLRTLETARLMQEQFGYDVDLVQEERIREIEFGVLDGMTERGVRERYPDELERKQKLGKYYYRPPGGESRPDVALRLQSFLSTLSREYRGQSVLLVTHSVIVLMFRRLLERLTEADYLKIDKDPRTEVFNCSVMHYACDASAGREGKLLLQEYNGIYYSPDLTSDAHCRDRAAECVSAGGAR